jgi:signal transduction histidine kinase
LVGYTVAILLSTGLAAYSLFRRSGRIADAFGLTMVAVLLWSLGSFGRFLAPTEPLWYALTLVMYAGVSTASVLLFVLAALYTGGGPTLTRRRLAALFVLPVISLALLATNSVHHLFFTDIAPTAFGDDTVFKAVAGPWFWVHSTYSYTFFGAATLLFARFSLNNRGIYRRQALSVIAGASVPWAVNVTYLFVLGGTFPLDPTPVGFAVGSSLLAYAVFGARLTDLTPVARSTVVDAIDDGVFVLDHQRERVDLNTAAESLVDDDDIIGTAVEEALPEILLADGDGPEPLEVGGTERWYRSHKIPLADSGSVLIVSDVTEQKRRRRQLREQNERLEEFTRVAAHDLRNPLNAISGYTDLARETGDISHLAQVDPATDRMETLVDDLLTLGQEGQVVEETEPVPIAEAAEKAWANVETSDARLEAVDDGWILADETRLTKLLEKLFRNCVEHGATGGSSGDRVTVRIGMLTDGFFVADDGIGIPTDARADVFDYGYSTHGGTGLGLPVVRSIAVAHGWEVSVTDSEDGGARFEFRSVQLHAGARPGRGEADAVWDDA